MSNNKKYLIIFVNELKKKKFDQCALFVYYVRSTFRNVWRLRSIQRTGFRFLEQRISDPINVVTYACVLGSVYVVSSINNTIIKKISTLSISQKKKKIFRTSCVSRPNRTRNLWIQFPFLFFFFFRVQNGEYTRVACVRELFSIRTAFRFLVFVFTLIIYLQIYIFRNGKFTLEPGYVIKRLFAVGEKSCG